MTITQNADGTYTATYKTLVCVGATRKAAMMHVLTLFYTALLTPKKEL